MYASAVQKPLYFQLGMEQAEFENEHAVAAQSRQRAHVRSAVASFFSASAAAQPKVPALQTATMASEALSARAVKGSSRRTKASHRSETARKTSGCRTSRIHQWADLASTWTIFANTVIASSATAASGMI